MKAEISLNDSKYFKLFIGDRVLQSEIYNIKGSIPIYSANVMKPFGYSPTTNIDDFSRDHILWGIDGDFSFNIIPKGTTFATTDHCGAIKILDSAIIPEYLIFGLELKGHLLGYDRTLRPTLDRMRRIIVKIPIDKNGNFDIATQKLAIDKYKVLRDIKKEIEDQIEELSSILIRVPLPEDSLEIRVSELFDLNQQSNQSWFTKQFIDQHKGDIPVYSASKYKDFVNYGYVQDSIEDVKYYKDTLTWNIDGSTGKVFFRQGKFALSEKVIPLILQEKWIGLVDNNYLKFMLEQEAISLELGFSVKAGRSKLRKIAIKFPYCVSDGKQIPDINKQKQIADEIEQTYALKQNIIECLQELLDVSIEV